MGVENDQVEPAIEILRVDLRDPPGVSRRAAADRGAARIVGRRHAAGSECRRRDRLHLAGAACGMPSFGATDLSWMPSGLCGM